MIVSSCSFDASLIAACSAWQLWYNCSSRKGHQEMWNNFYCLQHPTIYYVDSLIGLCALFNMKTCCSQALMPLIFYVEFFFVSTRFIVALYCDDNGIKFSRCIRLAQIKKRLCSRFMGMTRRTCYINNHNQWGFCINVSFFWKWLLQTPLLSIFYRSSATNQRDTAGVFTKTLGRIFLAPLWRTVLPNATNSPSLADRWRDVLTTRSGHFLRISCSSFIRAWRRSLMEAVHQGRKSKFLDWNKVFAIHEENSPETR